MKLYQVIGDVLGVDPDTISEQSNAQNTPGWDSLRHIEVIMAIEGAFHVRFTMPEMANFRNVGDIRDCLINKGAAIDRSLARDTAAA